ncbi:aminoacyl-tRNA hydrolase [Jeotgalicoccus sp. WY2]|uniref:aminoacyl-tRNA hydrolase n=1 Tax=Jeotgalicoccus sp. WY2 TaxID=2708346 RepID=UPI001BD4204E|nr:aminoacyl-tRNA hydrolase [Jeotgalicoccus sp. WY2]
MKCFIGLGNPGPKYDQTRHNIGFMAIDRLSSDTHIELDKSKFKCMYGTGLLNGEKIMLVKPQTFMNLSGEGVRPLVDYYNIELEDIVVIYDDLDLPLGRIRLRQKGSGGGHNGIKSLTQHFGSEKYNRIRLGIERPPAGMPVTNYVLGRFPEEDSKTLDKVLDVSSKACQSFVSGPFLDVMNEYNGDVNA